MLPPQSAGGLYPADSNVAVREAPNGGVTTATAGSTEIHSFWP